MGSWVLDVDLEKTLARVELYNLYLPHNRFPLNGWLVRHYLRDGRGTGYMRRFGTDEAAARTYAQKWNARYQQLAAGGGR